MRTVIGRGAILVAATMLASFASAQNIRVTVDGDLVAFAGTGPRMVNGRVLVPVRGVFEKMGANVEWNASTRTVTAIDADTDVKLMIGSRNAVINGNRETLDVPAQIIGGRTMVPLRFLSEALGADVEWVDSRREVVILTGGGGGTDIVRDRIERDDNRVALLLAENSVLPVTLNSQLSSAEARVGDTFTADIDEQQSGYTRLPAGTKLQGRVTAAKAQAGNQPGVLELDFNRLILPDGRTVSMNGALFSLENDSVTRDSNGVLVAKNEKKDDRLIFAGYGAGAGLLVGLLTKRPLEGAILGGILGYIIGSTNRDRENPTNVVLKPGTKFGVRLEQDAVVQVDR